MIEYEWDFESEDRNGDIEHDHCERLRDARSAWPLPEGECLVLVRTDSNGGREWAYVKPEGTLPETFSDAYERPGAAVPKRYHAELARWLAKNNSPIRSDLGHVFEKVQSPE